MQMIMREHQGKRLWTFTVDEGLLYELACNETAWSLFKRTHKSVDEIEDMTVKLVDKAIHQSEEDLAKVSNPFLRVVFQERKRLGLKEFQLMNGEPPDKEKEKS